MKNEENDQVLHDMDGGAACIEQALAGFEAGDYYTHAQMKEEILSWFRR